MSEPELTREVVQDRFAAIDAALPGNLRFRSAVLQDIAQEHVMRPQFDLPLCLREMAVGFYRYHMKMMFTLAELRAQQPDA